eukprot:CAMPEP_0203712538 /NCGR_PEP_ID=MMETSP0091-20130426/70090_1 /ASSEMBLY_ACC=CAM_ASM_001089 /TAXON_ID=426623 /ORGANISM="Chaetoceros affinis, Strain CCMP159" /LENGTH=449 /DNA_ID=CAMNT_0050590519 /DNA_START=129 /DNA_END=1478 /DNA_ORIENTATION=-
MKFVMFMIFMIIIDCPVAALTTAPTATTTYRPIAPYPFPSTSLSISPSVDAPSTSPSKSPSVTPSIDPTVYGVCPDGKRKIELNIIHDHFHQDIGYLLQNSCTGDIVSYVKEGTMDSNPYSTYHCVGGGNEYEFTIYDSYGDGMCCQYGYGYYEVYYDGRLAKKGGRFKSKEKIALGLCTATTSPTPSKKSLPCTESFVGTYYYYDAYDRHCYELSLSPTASHANQDAHGAVESACNPESFSVDYSVGFSYSSSFGVNQFTDGSYCGWWSFSVDYSVGFSYSSSFGVNQFTDGSYCGWWYGNRSSTVTIMSTSDVAEPTLSVTEPFTCRYEFVLKVPPSCEKLEPEPSYVHIPNTYCRYYDYGGDGPCENGRSFNDVWQQCEDDGPEQCMGVMWNSCGEAPTSDITVNGAWKLMTAGQEVGDANNPTATCGGKDQALGHWDVFMRKWQA